MKASLFSILILILFFSSIQAFSQEDVPEFQLFMLNDSMGIGWGNDWDDHRTFGAAAACFAGPWQFGLNFISYSARADTPADTIRTDLLDLTVGYSLPFSIAGIQMRVDLSAGAGLSGNMAGEIIQSAWHDMLGITRPVPTAYTHEWQIWPKAAAYTGIAVDDTLFYYVVAGPSLELSTISLHAKAGIGDKIIRGEDAFFLSYNFPVYSYDSFLSGITKTNEAGLWIGWTAEVSGFRVINKFNPVSGILDYQIGISTRAWNNSTENMSTTRRLVLGSFIDRLCLASAYTIGPKVPLFGPGSPDFRLRLQMQNGEQLGVPPGDDAIHLQNITLGIECPFMFVIGEWHTGIVFYTGSGIRTEQRYLNILEKADILSEAVGFCIEAEAALRIEWHAEFMAPSFYGIEIAAGTIQAVIGDPVGLKSDIMISVRAIFGVE